MHVYKKRCAVVMISQARSTGAALSEGANCVCCDATVANCEAKCDVVEFSTTRFRLGTLCQRFQIGLKQMSLCHSELRADQNKNWQMEKKIS